MLGPAIGLPQSNGISRSYCRRSASAGRYPASGRCLPDCEISTEGASLDAVSSGRLASYETSYRTVAFDSSSDGRTTANTVGAEPQGAYGETRHQASSRLFIVCRVVSYRVIISCLGYFRPSGVRLDQMFERLRLSRHRGFAFPQSPPVQLLVLLFEVQL